MSSGVDNLTKNKAIQYGIAALIIIPSVVFIGWGIKKYVIGSIARDPSKDTAKDLGKEVNKNRLTYPESTYKTMADSIYRAMDGAGTTWTTVVRVISALRNADDWKMLVSTFGVKKSTVWSSSFSGNLIEWLEDELDGSEMKEISGMLNKINVTI